MKTTIDKSEILDFYSRFSDFNDMANLSYVQRSGDDRSRGLRQVKAAECCIIYSDPSDQVIDTSNQNENTESEESLYSLRLNLNNHLVGYLDKNVSPIVKAKNSKKELEDTNKLFLAIAFMKVYFEEQDSHAYFPLLMVEVTEDKKDMYKSAKKTGTAILDINFAKDLLINEEVVNFFYDITFEENGSNINEYIATSIEDFVPENELTSVKSILDYTYNFFKKNQALKGFEIQYPVISNDKSSAFMFFNTKTNIKSKKEFDSMKKEDNPLIDEYLGFSQIENKAPVMDNSIWYGSLTKEYPLGEGQALVLQENQKGIHIIPTVGGPGTGKTTLFLSVISNIVTKRALSNIEHGYDYNNLTLVTSTSNKAVENVYKSLKKGFKHGFCYVGGNSLNRMESATEVAEFIEIIKSEEFDQKKLDRYKKSVINIKSFIDKRKVSFMEILSHKSMIESYKIKDFQSLANVEEQLFSDTDSYSEKSLDRSLSGMNSIVIKINALTSKNFDYNQVILFVENGQLEKLELALAKLNNLGFLDKFLHSKEIFKDLNLVFKLENKNELEIVIDLLSKFKNKLPDFKDLFKTKQDFENLKVLSVLSMKFSENQKVFDHMLKYNDFGNYFRLELFSLNYKLYIQSYNYLYQKLLSEKDKVILALGYLTQTSNQYQYLIDNFGRSIPNIEEFLRLISLSYPITTSTLAAIGGMFPEIYPNKVLTYETILADESGMICANDILPALRRAKRSIIVGDPKQLEPIVSMNDLFLSSLQDNYSKEFWDKYSPSKVTAFHRAAGTIVGGFQATGRGIILDEHRRCAPKIAELFIKVAEYEGLHVRTPVPKSKAFKGINEESLMFFDTKNPDKVGFKKINEGEIETIYKILMRLQAAGYHLDKDIGIITPYKDQETYLIRRFGELLKHDPKKEAKIGTVHKFQGVEYKVVLFSSVVSRSQDSLSFINKNPSLMNVAISRAQDCFIMIGDYDRVVKDKKDNFIGICADHVKLNGTFVKMK